MPEFAQKMEGEMTNGGGKLVARVVVIDDSALIAQMTQEMLEEAGYAVRVFTRASEALESLAEYRPDVVLCDLSLGGGTHGFDVAKAVGKMELEPRPLMIAVTGYDDESTEARAHQAGFSGFIAKPIEIEGLEQTLRRISAKR